MTMNQTVTIDYTGTLFDLDVQIHLLEATSPAALIGDDLLKWARTLTDLSRQFEQLAGRRWQSRLGMRNEYTMSPREIRDAVECWYIQHDPEGLES